MISMYGLDRKLSQKDIHRFITWRGKKAGKTIFLGKKGKNVVHFLNTDLFCLNVSFFQSLYRRKKALKSSIMSND